MKVRWNNLDYPIFSVPFGLAIISRSIAEEDVQSVYAECCLINSWNWSMQAGQAMVMTNVSIICDRVLPITFSGNVAERQIEEALDKLALNTEG